MENLQPHKFNLQTYAQIFSTKESLTAKILRATSRLAVAMGQPIDPGQLEIWAQALSCFHPTELAWGFTQTEITVEAWPTPAKVANLIMARQFSADLTWLLTHLKIHGIEWKDIEAREFRGDYDPETASWGVIKKPFIPAPPMPQHLKRALASFGSGTEQDGLSRLAAHPKLKPGLYDTETEKHRAQERMENGFRVAWISARMP